ncbi:hypothetical protein [Actinoalloteichus hymeniacidonis]|uniref:Uncharacterized protein n=1 Tax=Actinoalloteichus hymeniacidonis TaxID=340345 RepID=A0AAC9HRV6_9PSEU|nr:hypothetical protein [Actinoalloteichus hymeniacidonis]AOS64240.1 hypothetical protein TL08_17200 [Actinoalloteichus hymeniacidonis]MBB5907692.1 hypothetical protein [Actinoalloteichus hymeniacidonis]
MSDVVRPEHTPDPGAPLGSDAAAAAGVSPLEPPPGGGLRMLGAESAVACEGDSCLIPVDAADTPRAESPPTGA